MTRLPLRVHGFFVFIVILAFVLPLHAYGSSNLLLSDWKSEPVRRILNLCEAPISSSTLPWREDRVLRFLNEADRSGCIPLESPLKSVLQEMVAEMSAQAQKPLVPAYHLRTEWADHPFLRDNAFGESMDKGFRSTLHIRLRTDLPGGFSVDLLPRLRAAGIGDENNLEGDLWTGYLKWTLRNVELEIGRDSLWWGPGYHGSTVLTNNIAPLDLVKLSNVEPFRFPWLFRYLGDTNLAVFWSRTSEQTIRYIDNGVSKTKNERPQFLGIRAEIQPVSFFRFGGTLTSQFVSRGDTMTWDDWRKVLLPTWGGNELEDTGGPIVNRRYAYDFLLRTNRLPYAEYGEIYLEYGGEVGIMTKVFEIPHPKPQFINEVIGTYVDFGKLDFRFEVFTPWNLPDNIIPYAHYQFTEGYRHEGRIIGHEAGPGTRDYFVRSTYILPGESILGLDLDYEEHYKENWNETVFGTDLLFYGASNWTGKVRYEFRDGNRDSGVHDISYGELSLFYRF